MDCQTSCQDEEFESCEYEFRADCSASCSGDGALFCDGEYVLSGSEIGPCIDALIARSIGELDVQGEVDGKLTSDAGGGCQMGAGVTPGWAAWSLAVVGAAFFRRRRNVNPRRDRRS